MGGCNGYVVVRRLMCGCVVEWVGYILERGLCSNRLCYQSRIDDNLTQTGPKTF